MIKRNEIQRLRLQRNGAGVAAVLLMAIGLVICLPRSLERRKHLQAANDELLSLQSQIEDTQSRIRSVQKQIIQAQSEIRSLLHDNR